MRFNSYWLGTCNPSGVCSIAGGGIAPSRGSETTIVSRGAKVHSFRFGAFRENSDRHHFPGTGKWCLSLFSQNAIIRDSGIPIGRDPIDDISGERSSMRGMRTGGRSSGKASSFDIPEDGGQEGSGPARLRARPLARPVSPVLLARRGSRSSRLLVLPHPLAPSRPARAGQPEGRRRSRPASAPGLVHRPRRAGAGPLPVPHPAVHDLRLAPHRAGPEEPPLRTSAPAAARPSTTATPRATLMAVATNDLSAIRDVLGAGASCTR